jgi:hypothetical protein
MHRSKKKLVCHLVSAAERPAISPNRCYGISAGPGSARLGTGELDHLGPLLGFVRNELAELGWRAGKRRAAQVSKPRLDFGIGERRVDLLVQLIDDFGGRALRRANTAPVTCLEPRYEIAQGSLCPLRVIRDRPIRYRQSHMSALLLKADIGRRRKRDRYVSMGLARN